MKLGYYIPCLKTKQVKQQGKVIGYIELRHYDYGYRVTLYLFGKAGYPVDKYLPTREKAESFFDKVFNEYNF